MTDNDRAVRTSTDPAFVRQQLGLPPKPSKAFSAAILIIGVLAFYGAFYACASI